jgi:superfamily II RNA helicase
MKLSPFQIKAIDNIKLGNHVLVTAHTGSGKTLPAEKAIEYFTSQNKKVIYTSPIKALSNQKFNDFSLKYPDIEVGLLTGDIKHNPGADLLIMTTEILQNKLFRLNTNVSSFFDFDIDIETELGCVIFDEVHYINDKDRGCVWENTIIMLPNHVQFVMLSATIGNPDEFGGWIERIKQKPVAICSTTERVVPLIFYNYFVASGIDKITNKEEQKKINNITNTLNVIKENDKINYDRLHQTNQALTILDKNYKSSSRSFVVNELCNNLRDKEMFPALMFVFSRKQVERIANEISVPLFQENEKDYMVEPVYRQLLVSKVSNWKEYKMLPEYEVYLKLLEKGIGLHHAGMLPIFREMIEILYERKFIKILIATETFAIGLNMPTKTVCFTSLFKYDGSKSRRLHSHEFTQMAGRAGRRNIDTVGHVIILSNLFNQIKPEEYINIFNAKSNNIVSKFKIDYDLILFYISAGLSSEDIITFIKKSFMNVDIECESEYLQETITQLKDRLSAMNCPDAVNTYIELQKKASTMKPNQKKKVMKEIKQLNINETDVDIYNEIQSVKNELYQKEQSKIYTDTYIQNSVCNILSIANKYKYVINGDTLTDKGKMYCTIHEINPFIFCELHEYTNGFTHYNDSELFSLFSMFYELKTDVVNSSEMFPKEIVFIQNTIDDIMQTELQYQIGLTNVTFQTTLHTYVYEWMEQCDDEVTSTILLNKIKEEVFIGEFIKCCLKVIHVCNELRTISSPDLLEKINTGCHKLKKFIISNNSLYL